MLKALNDRILIRKTELEKPNEKEIYMPVLKENYYEVVEASCGRGLVQVGDIVVVKKEQLYQIYHEGKEYYVVKKDDILAKLVK